jgi:hypothetical protein
MQNLLRLTLALLLTMLASFALAGDPVKGKKKGNDLCGLSWR